MSKKFPNVFGKFKTPDITGYRNWMWMIAPYFLHISMVLAVAVYVFLGAATIRAIEAIEKTNDSNFNLQTASKSEKYWHSIYQQRTSRNANRTINTKHEYINNNKNTENKINQKRNKSLTRSRKCVTTVLKKIANESKCDKTNINTDLMNLLDECYHEDLKMIIKRSHQNNHKSKDQKNDKLEQKKSNIKKYEYWSWTDAVLFCFTVITTIGYGNVAPKTLQGQLFVIIYGLFGVPFSMVVIANLGKFLAELLKAWIRPFRNLFKKIIKLIINNHRRRTSYNKEKVNLVTKNNNIIDDNEYNNNNNNDSNRSISYIDQDNENSYDDLNSNMGYSEYSEDSSLHKDAASLFFAFALYIIIGSMIISSYEPDMDVFKAIYYIFVSLTTIGLGDVVPRSESYLLFTLIYIAVGLALTTIAIEIASDYLKKLHYFGRKMENVGNVQIWFGSKKLTMKQLVKNLGDQFNLPAEEMNNLNLDTFVDNAIKVEEGVMSTLRNSQYPYGIKPIFITDFKDAGNVIFADEDERYIIYNYAREAYEKCPPPALRPNGVIPLLLQQKPK